MASLTSIRPMLHVNDMHTTMSFWTDQLGFTTTSSMAPEDVSTPFWCNLTRDGLSIMFTHEAEHTHDDGEVHKTEAQLAGAIYFNVDNVDALTAEFIDRGTLPASTRPDLQPYAMREICVTDPNGFEIFFGQPA